MKASADFITIIILKSKGRLQLSFIRTFAVGVRVVEFQFMRLAGSAEHQRQYQTELPLTLGVDKHSRQESLNE
jgi:hypothetical protein